MRQHLVDLLDVWQADYQDDWVVAVLTHVQGSSYRKPGAIMLFHPLGKTLGMLSGGCLEADLRRHAQRAIQTQQVIQLTYDATDESDTSYQLGCGGIVNIMMLAVNSANQYLGLQQLYFDLQSGKKGQYQLDIAQDGSPCSSVIGLWQTDEVICAIDANSGGDGATSPQGPTAIKTQVRPIIEADYPHKHRIIIPVSPPIHIGIFGGGLDAQPLAQIAHNLGWKISVFDERTAYARSYDFPHCTVYKMPVDKVAQELLASLNGAFIMNHNLNLDAKALGVLVSQPLGYIALLGPAHRRDKVLELAQLAAEDFNGYFSAPAGIALGGELPSSVALSMLAQCHGVLHQSQLLSLDKVML